jgi:hypothetical protein
MRQPKLSSMKPLDIVADPGPSVADRELPSPQVPVDWIGDTDSRVDILATALADLRGIIRLGCGLMRGTIKVPESGGHCAPVPAVPHVGVRPWRSRDRAG